MTEKARELVSAAEGLLRPPAGPAGPLGPGVRARVAAVLLRLALDRGLDDFWQGVAPAMTRVAKHRIFCLEVYTDRATARRCYLTWSALSGVCHPRPHDMPPNSTEMYARLLEVTALLDALAEASAATAAARIPAPAPPAGLPADLAGAAVVTPAQRLRADTAAPKPGPPPGRRAAPPVVGGA
ncbi:hypothetical protein AB0A77_27180 [Streptomyces varsoviensis]|uniref:hypothetical protein n=1 Tax=Streptomyces varsoviensis TaxID=67373 RepID=UPI0033DCA7C2